MKGKGKAREKAESKSWQREEIRKNLVITGLKPRATWSCCVRMSRSTSHANYRHCALEEDDPD
jgi:hypothetical protein